jgi:succinate dehydrogenase/fumarate reductase flavoprotein subunit
MESSARGITLFNCTNIIFAVGGPAGMYLTSVYPESQTGSSGIAFEAGAKGINLTESQFGIASIKFRWNLSGTYQQVIPRYVSTNQDGSDEREFLDEYFDTAGSMMDAIFLKGYQWPFDPRKIKNYGSSLIDILVHNETQIKGRRVFLDFMSNPAWGS